ncbi:TauD/TfdA family dioxygenase [Bradyrhizobium lablabi]|uniref:TauD/TfdA family dioxygenase n=1 Tax=Bradyrhizobium lablabi TaxID=722472 RepID=UPI001BA5C098|nr:TauD/TfdA family dioxygenase [Bradyrhizobium lablabi]MBR0696576.1 TauD/TfdA family dioxygenase [Bradyrhizobium lablabi]
MRGFSLESFPYSSFGALLRADAHKVPTDIDPIELESLVSNYGAVLLRGIPVHLEGFETLTRLFGTPVQAHINLHLERQHHTRQALSRASVGLDGFTRTVNAGSSAINPHSESYYSPFCPDLVWFLCKQPPNSFGRTGLCDGVEVLAHLPPAIRGQYEKLEMVNHSIFDAAIFCALSNIDSIETSFARIRETRRLDLSWMMHRDGRFEFTYRAPMIRKTRFGGARAFANNALGGSGASLDEFKADGRPFRRSHLEKYGVTPSMADAGLETAERLMAWISWERGDLLVLDNTRIMHAREPFLGGREILVRMSASRTGN